MSLFRFLLAGAAVAAGVHYVNRKRPDGTSIADDFKARYPEWKDRAQSFLNQFDERFAGIAHIKGRNSGVYPEKFENKSADPAEDYSS